MKRLLAIILLGFLCAPVFGQTPIWENLFHSNRAFTTITQTKDNAFVATGVEHGPNTTFPQHYAKYTIDGGLIWQRNGRVLLTGEEDMKETPDGKLYFTASVKRYTPQLSSYNFLQQMDPDGDTSATWTRTYIDAGNEVPVSLILLDSGDFSIAGFARIGTKSGLSIRRTDSNGITRWHRKFGKASGVYPANCIRSRRGNLVMLAAIMRQSGTRYKPFIFEMSAAGDSIKGVQLDVLSPQLSEIPSRFFNNIIQVQDGGYVFTGYFSDGNENAFVAKIDSAFNLLWHYEMPIQNPMGFTIKSQKIQELQDSTLVFTATENPVQPNGLYITRLSKNGQFISRINLISTIAPNGILLYDWKFLPDSTVVIAGLAEGVAYIGRWGNLGFPPAVVEPPLVSATPQVAQLPKVQLYPNPANQQVRVQLTNAQTGLLQLYSVTGRQVLQQQVTNQSTVSLKNLPQGLYLYKLLANEQVVSGKLVVE